MFSSGLHQDKLYKIYEDKTVKFSSRFVPHCVLFGLRTHCASSHLNTAIWQDKFVFSNGGVNKMELSVCSATDIFCFPRYVSEQVAKESHKNSGGNLKQNNFQRKLLTDRGVYFKL